MNKSSQPSIVFIFFLTALFVFVTGATVAQAQSATTVSSNQAFTTSVQPLIEAVKSGDLELTRALIAQGVDVNVSQGDGATALHWAAHRNNLAVVGLLIDAGANVNTANQLGATPLWLSAMNGNADIAELLLQAGANPNAPLKMGETPLMTASRSGNLETLEVLLKHSANVNAIEYERGQTALMWAAAQQHARQVQLLIDHGAYLHSRSKVWYQLENSAGNTNPSGNFKMARGGSTALLFAARNGDIETTRVLLEAGANVQDISAAGTSALTMAAHSGHGPLAIFLLQRGADPNAKEAGYTALHAAVLRSQVQLVQALLKQGANANTKIEHGTAGRRFSADYSIRAQLIGRNALWLAAKYGEVEILRILLDHGVDPFTVTEYGVTTLQVAMGNSGSSLDHRRDRIGNAAPDLKDEQRRTLALAKILIDLGVNVNAADNRDQTALHHAVLKDFPLVVEYLIEQGADINAATERGQTPLSLAETVQTIPGTNGLRGMRPEVAAVLRRLGAEG